jgi:folylpolyglutamate synthase/dihydropteroate synthase
MREFVRTWKDSPFGKRGMDLIFGVLKDKDYRKVVREIAPLVKRVTLVPPPTTRALDPQELAKVWRRYLPEGAVRCAASFAGALDAMHNSTCVAVTGSLYLVGEALRYIGVDDTCERT